MEDTTSDSSDSESTVEEQESSEVKWEKTSNPEAKADDDDTTYSQPEDVEILDELLDEFIKDVDMGDGTFVGIRRFDDLYKGEREDAKKANKEEEEQRINEELTKQER